MDLSEIDSVEVSKQDTGKGSGEAIPKVRPLIGNYREPAVFVRDMLQFRRQQDRKFSVQKATQGLRKISPALVSLVIQGKRKLTIDRVDEFAKLLGLNSAEKSHFKSWITGGEPKPLDSGSRKEVGLSILNDWLNVYVKDLFHLREVQENPELVERLLATLASPQRIRRSVEFLVREGHLRRNLDGKLVIETNLTVTDPGVPSAKIKLFHKGALSLAKQAIDLYSVNERMANALLVPLDAKRHEELLELINEFAERLKDFTAQDSVDADRLYQVLINLSPVGGKSK